ncbi:uncharacterized protein [Salminus brasiliensis]|uniref:uncharacterized protein n=1 Tax=Salminus brasiliensis TaxID=930266 RepID=UPI003B833A66
MMELQNSSTGGGSSDPELQPERVPIENPPNFSGEGGEPSCVSVKSDRSIGNPPNFSGERGEPSCVSVKSDRSMGNPPNFSGEGGEPSCVSVKSDRSIGNPPNFSGEGGEPSCVSVKSDRSIGNPPNFSGEREEPSCVSVKSDRSMGNPPNFSGEGGEPSCVSVKSDRSIGNPPNFSGERGEPSCVSVKSDRSMGNPPNFSGEGGEPSCVSVKSDRSMGNPPNFSGERGEPSCVSVKSDRSIGNPPNFSGDGGEPSCVSVKSDRSMGNPPNFSGEGGEPSCVSVKSDRSMGNPPNFSGERGEPSCVSVKSDRSIGNPPNFSGEGGEPSCVSVKSDRSMGNPPNFSGEGGEPSCVSVKSDRSIGNPPNFSGEGGEPSCVSVKSDRSMGNPPNFSGEGGEPSCVSVKSDRSMGNPPNFSGEGGEPSCVSVKSDRSMGNPPNFSGEGGEPSCVSVKSDRSMGNPPNFSGEGGEPSCVSVKSDRSKGNPPNFSGEGGEPSCVSVKSDRSMGNPPNFSGEGGEPSCVSVKSDRSMGNPPNFSGERGEPSCVSVKSDRSMGNPPNFSGEGGEPSCVSVKSDRSMGNPPNFSGERGEPSCVSVKSDRSIGNPPNFSGERGEPSCVSVKSDRSMGNPPNFSGERGEPSCVSVKSDRSMGNPPNFSGERGEPSCVSVKSDRSMGNPPNFSGDVVSESEQISTQTLTEGPGDQQQDSHQPVDEVLHRVSERHKTSMKNKYESLFEGLKTEENRILLNRIYTQLYIIEGESDGVNEEHEVLEMEKTPRKHLQDTPVHCADIFKPLQGPIRDTGEENTGKIRTVLTKGIAGIGKTVSVQKFILDWAEGKANQDVELMFVLPFRELNLIKDHQYSLHQLLCVFHPELKDLEPKIYDVCKAVFIFDGLDESRIPLNFSKCKKVSDVTMTSSVGVVMSNLIKGELLPSALIWITSRPAAANQIPPRSVNRLTEIHGFTDPQKEEYFRKRISDQEEAQKIISHIKTARSLHIMCHIPVFCWISATVLQQMIKQRHTEIPKTLTEMYLHFLLTQINMKNQKYEENHERDPKELLQSNRTELLKLAELAFKQLMKGNVMFYEEDLRESGIDVTEASVHSGIFTEIFREECVLYQRKVYCFVHLSFQEFLAAVFVFHCFESKNMEVLEFFSRSRSRKTAALDELLKGAVCKALKCENGRLDLFLRFLLGISLETNQRLLQGLLTYRQSSTKQTTEFIKKLIKGDEDELLYTILDRSLCTERSSSLLFCLSEMNDQSLSRELQESLRSDKHSEKKLSPGHCSIMAYMLLMSEEVLDELDPKKYNTSEEGYRRLISAVSVCRKALLAGCGGNMESCRKVTSALQSSNCCLRELDLSNNDLQDSGVELLSAGLKSSHCNLQTLRLAGCNLTKVSCEKLSSALQSVNSCLRELDLSNNELQDSGVKLLSAGLESPHCNLQTLRLAFCSFGENACRILGSALQSENSCLRELDLSNNDLQDSGVELLSAGLESPHCKLETLRLSGCLVTEKGCSSLASALTLKLSTLRELDLTYNHPGESGVRQLSELKQNPHCKLKTLRVEHGAKIRLQPGLKKYACEITLDPNTTHPFLSQCEENRKVESVEKRQPYPDHPKRFDRIPQVLCRESLTGRCYWEVEWSGRVAVAVSYRGISRDAYNQYCMFGLNQLSWRLVVRDGKGYFQHNLKDSEIFATPSSKVGVYLDWPAGTLSFYSISPNTHTLSHLYTLHSTFREPLYAGFWVDSDSSVCLCVSE